MLDIKHIAQNRLSVEEFDFSIKILNHIPNLAWFGIFSI